MQIAAYLPDAQGQVPINLINDFDHRMDQYKNNIRNGTQMHVPNSISKYQSICWLNLPVALPQSSRTHNSA